MGQREGHHGHPAQQSEGVQEGEQRAGVLEVAVDRIKLDATPPWGSGLGDAYVYLQDKTFLFHNSYWAALQEGGWVLAGFYVLLTVGLGVSLLRTRSAGTGWAGAEAANVAVLVCALSLGEVFGAATAMTALGAGLLGVMARRRALAATDEAPLAAPAPPGPAVADRPGRGG
ncbi:hypothetical protein [Phycicoccus duodecadis]|uniref:hypothetical protein n=1 Tax=Phycicoccus duodecadis TaxID=173053 RepID=UPI001FE8D8CC|nr:hypothetical protein [Phycicoccus duodecadis]